MIKKVVNLGVWILLLYESTNFHFTPRLILNLFYTSLIITFVFVKITQVSFPELASHFVIGIYSYLSDLVLFLPRMENFRAEKRFSDNDISSFQIFGTILLISEERGFFYFLVWTLAVTLLTLVTTGLKKLENDTTNFESYRSLAILFLGLCVLTKIAMNAHIPYMLLLFLITITSNHVYSASVLSLFRRFMTFSNIIIGLIMLRIILFTVLMYLLIFHTMKPFQYYSLKHKVLIITVSLEFYYSAYENIKNSFTKKRIRSTSSKDFSKEQLEVYMDPCPICLANMDTAKITTCGHVFHDDCLDLCLQRKPSCPLCRQMLLD